MPCIRARYLASAFLMVASVAVIAQPQASVEVGQIRINGAYLSYVDQGRGTPVVFAHGAVSDLRFWEPQRDAVAKQFRYVAYSYRYHGTTPWPDDGKQYSAETHEADLAALISSLKAGPVHLVGLSYGGLLAAKVAVDRPNLVRTLTLAEPALHPLLVETTDGKALLEEWTRQSEPMVAALNTGDYAGAVRHLSALVTGGPPEDFDTFPAPFRQMLLDNARTMPLLFAAAPSVVTCDMLKAIKVPTLVVRGERTTRVFSRVNDESARCIPGSRQVVIPKASHAMSYDNPDEFNRVLMEFLRASRG